MTTTQPIPIPTAREQVFIDYTYSHGLITSPGKFEGEPTFTPYFWNLALEGFADRDDGRIYSFKFVSDDEEMKAWPGLKSWLGCKRTLRLVENEQGFVHCF